jgi:DNA-binding MarR family transcriptional regulator
MLMYLTKCESTPTQTDLAKHFDISPAAVAVTLKKLESDGYIERSKSIERKDSRFNEIKITERGTQAVMQSRKYFQHVDNEALKDFYDEELALFTSFLERMSQNLKCIPPIPTAEDQ